MVLVQWLERGLGQVLAPDKSYKEHPDQTDTSSSFWSTVAPDPKFPNSDAPGNAKAPPQHAFNMIQCIHCHEYTPIGGSNASDIPSKEDNEKQSALDIKSPPPRKAGGTPYSFSTALSPTPAFITKFTTPSPSAKATEIPTPAFLSNYDESDTYALELNKVWKSTMVAVQQTAISASLTSTEYKTIGTLFSSIVNTANSQPLSQKALDKFKQRLQQLERPYELIFTARSRQLGNLCPDGYTLFLACAYANQVDAGKAVVEIVQSNATKNDDYTVTALLCQVNLEGKNALAIAAERGHLDILNYLKVLYSEAGDSGKVNVPASLDLLGRTPLGVALTSPVPKAQQNQARLYASLYTPNDLSLIGSPLPRNKRQIISDGSYVTKTNINSLMQCVMATSHIPGKRIRNEDACSLNMITVGKSSMACAGVCDGHSDKGLMSEWLCANFPLTVQDKINSIYKSGNAVSTHEWESQLREATLFLDNELRERNKHITGGSTGVWAIVNSTQVIVTNVGDSRCILLQTRVSTKEDGSDVSKKLQSLSLDDTDKPKSRFTVIPLSTDHKPDLPNERERIERAGMEIEITELPSTNGSESTTIARVVSTDGKERLACSRTFGDFEFKALTTLGPEDQAVTAVPQVTVHQRDRKRDAMLVLACDGIWDVMSNVQVANFIQQELDNARDDNRDYSEGTVLPGIGDALVRECLKLGSEDNLTVALVALGGIADQVISQNSAKAGSVDTKQGSGSDTITGKILDFTDA